MLKFTMVYLIPPLAAQNDVAASADFTERVLVHARTQLDENSL